MAIKIKSKNIYCSHRNKLSWSCIVEWHLMRLSHEFLLWNNWVPLSIIDKLGINTELRVSCFSDIMNGFAFYCRLLNMTAYEWNWSDNRMYRWTNRQRRNYFEWCPPVVPSRTLNYVQVRYLEELFRLCELVEFVTIWWDKQNIQ